MVKGRLFNCEPDADRKFLFTLSGMNLSNQIRSGIIIVADHDRIDHGIKLWDKVIICCSEASLTSWWVDKGLDRALQKDERLWKERQEKVLAIIPVDLDGYVHSWGGGKAGMVRSIISVS